MPTPRYQRKQLFFSESTPFHVQHCVLDGNGSKAHDHDFFELVVITGGEGTHQTMDGNMDVTAGDVFVLRSGVWHAYHDCRSLGVFNCCFGNELVAQHLTWFFADPPIKHLLWTGPLQPSAGGWLHLRLSPSALANCVQHLEDMETQLVDKPDGQPTALLGHFFLILATIGQHVAKPHTDTPSHPAVPVVIDLLERHPDREWTLGALAERAGLVPEHLVRVFKADSGLSPIAYLGRIRAETAARSLAQTNQPIAEIGRQVGWNDANYFARRFRQFFGVSPSAYRRQTRT